MALRPTVSYGLPSPCGSPRRQRRIGGGLALRRIDPHNAHPLTGFESAHALSFLFYAYFSGIARPDGQFFSPGAGREGVLAYPLFIFCRIYIMYAPSPPGSFNNPGGNHVSHLLNRYTISFPCLMTQSEKIPSAAQQGSTLSLCTVSIL